MDRFLPDPPPPEETWTHLALAAAIWGALYLVTPSRFIETSGPAGVITIFALGLVALALSVTVWMLSPPSVRRAMLHLRWIVPIGFLVFAFVERNRSERDALAERERIRALAATHAAPEPAAITMAPTTPSAAAATAEPEPADAGEPKWPPKIDELVSGPLPATLTRSEELIAIYRWGDRRQLRFPIRIADGSTPDRVAAKIQRVLDGREVPLTVELDAHQRLIVSQGLTASPDDRWFLGSQHSESAIDLPQFPH